VNDLYLILGRTIAGLSPPGFAKAALSARMVEGEPPVMSLACTGADGEEDFPPIGEEARDALAAALEAVRDAQAAEDGKAWRTCTVTLSAGGGFDMDVGD
jgi:hypothetical protein